MGVTYTSDGNAPPLYQTLTIIFCCVLTTSFYVTTDNRCYVLPEHELTNLIKVPQQSDKDITVLGVVEDVALHDLGSVFKSLVLRTAHLMNVEQQLTVSLHCIVEP